MKKRLRRKLRLGEFREECFELTFEVDSSISGDQVESLTDDFITMIKARNLQYGGGGKHTWTGIVQGPYRGSTTNADRDSVLKWLQDHPQIISAHAGPLRDAWHGWS